MTTLERRVAKYSDEKLLSELRAMLIFGAPAKSKLTLYAEVEKRGLEDQL